MAVLPFQNLSDKTGVDHIVLGFVEDLIIDLSRFGLTVISSHSTESINQENERDSLHQLKTNYHIKGSFRFLGDKVRINVQLIKSDNGAVIFAGRHDESYDSLVSLQDEITLQIVNVLQQKISTDIVATLDKSRPAKLAAYEYWLKGMQGLKNGTLENDLNARKLFNQSLAID